MSLWLFVSVCAAGALGALTRFVVDAEVRRRRPTTFPWATFAINVSGSLLLGLVTGVLLTSGGPGEVKAVVGTGFCGGYTTFSTAMVETVRLAQRGRPSLALGNALGTWLATVAAAGIGVALGEALGRL